jgi:hypothetical protein
MNLRERKRPDQAPPRPHGAHRKASGPIDAARRKVHWPDTVPNGRELRLLRLIGVHDGLRVTFGPHGRQFSCGDGVPVRSGKDRPFGDRDFAKFIELGWLRPDPAAPGLFPGVTAQRYFALPR